MSQLAVVPRTPIPQFTIHVTKELIDRASPEHASTCMVAQALRIQHGVAQVRVTAETIQFNRLGVDVDGVEKVMRYLYPTPAKAAVSIVKFDENKSQVQPFTFRLGHKNAYARPVQRRLVGKRGPTKNRVAPTAKRCIRRARGLRIIETSGK